MRELAIKNATLATFGPDNSVLENQTILIKNGKITQIGDSANIDIPQTLDIIDAQNNLVMPGLVNAHMHLYSTFARGITLDSPPARNFYDILNSLWWKLDKTLTTEDIYYSALIPLIGCIKYGTTTIIDHHASPNTIEGSLFTIAKAAKATGIRTSLAYEISDRDGKRITEVGIKENVEFIRAHHEDSMLRGLIGLHAAFTVSESTLQKVSDVFKSLNSGIHIHLCEDKYDRDFNIDQFGKTPVERLSEAGLLNEKAILAHGIYLDNKDLETIKHFDSKLVHNAQSNMNNAVGCLDLKSLLDTGISVGLGTDGMTYNMLEELNTANLIHKDRRQENGFGWTEFPNIVMSNNPRIASTIFGEKIGLLEVGAAADLIIMDYDPPTPLTSSNFWGHMLFGMTKSRVKTTIVNGNVLMKDYQLLIDVDEAEINAKSRELAAKFWKRFNDV